MEIVRINADAIKDITGINEPFEIIGRLNPVFTHGEWTYTEELLADPYLHTYPDDDTDYSEYVDNPYKTARRRPAPLRRRPARTPRALSTPNSATNSPPTRGVCRGP